MRRTAGSASRTLALLFAVVTLAAGGAAGTTRLEISETEPYVPGQVVVALRAGAAAPSALGPGPAGPAGAIPAETLEALRARPGVARLRRAIRRLGDEEGRAVRRTRDEVRSRLARRGLGPATALEPELDDVPDLENVFVVELEGDLTVPEAIASLMNVGEVVWAEPNWIYTITAEPLPQLPLVPDDRYLTQDGVTWAEGAFGQDFPDLYGLRSTRAIESWNELDLDGSGTFEAGETRPGEATVVAVIDTGVDAAHPDLAANIWVNPGEIPGNGIDDDGNGMVDDVSGWDFVVDDADPSDPNGHGTHVAGTIAALAGNGGVGIAGVAPAARILPLRGLSANGGGTAVDLAEAIDYAVAVGADITSSSWGGPGGSALIESAFAAAEAAGLLNVVSAGNGNKDALSQSPAKLASVLAVAAVDHEDRRASFSNFGRRVAISAPGVHVLSLSSNGGENVIARALPDLVVDDDYIQLNGTSMSCPHVSGAAAVLMSAYPGETALEIRGRLLGGARDIDAKNPGFEGRLGAGTLDLHGSLIAEPVPLLHLYEATAQNLLAGQQAEVTVWLQNSWAPASNVTAELSSGHPDVRIDRSGAALGSPGTGEYAANEAEPFRVSLAADTPFGEVPFQLVVRADGGFTTRFDFTLTLSFMSDVTSLAGVKRSGLLPRFTLFQDYTADGLPEILMADLLGDLFYYRNQGDGTFRRAKREVGIPGDFNPWTSHFLDIDNDGDRDMLLGGRVQEGSRLLLNTGDGDTRDISEASGLASLGLHWSAALDYDGDGFVDLLGGHGRGNGPKADWGPLHLLQNQGDLTFIDRAPEAGLPEAPFPSGLGHVAAFDYDDDGDPDVLLVAFGAGISLWQNEGDGTFTDRTDAAFPDFAPGSLSGAALGDCDNDGDIDLYLTGPPSGLDPPSRILHNRDGVFHDAGESAGDLFTHNVTGVFWGNALFDVDNDGDLDLYVSKDVTYADSALPGVDRNPLFLNDGSCRFTLASDRAFPRHIAPLGGAAAVADYDGDGDLDVYAPASDLFGGEGGLLRNELGDDLHGLKVTLEGTASARDAHGARVRLEAGGVSQLRELHGSTVDPSVAHFGLAEHTVADRLEVRWPSGIVQEFHEIAADGTFHIVEVDCGAGRDRDGDGVCDERPVAIDVEPGSPFNLVLPKSWLAVPVAVLGAEDFDVGEVDPDSLAFGPDGAAPLAWFCRAGSDEGGGGWGGIECGATPFLEDVDGDGFDDLVAHFRPLATGIQREDREACLTGATFAGVELLGCDAILTVPVCGLGFELILVLPPLLLLHRRRLAQA